MMISILKITPENSQKFQYRPAILGVIKPIEFIELTSGKNLTVSKIFQETQIMLKDYNPNGYAIPWLRITPRGRIIGHNGRHRAAMAITAGHTIYPVCLVVQEMDFSLQPAEYTTVESPQVPEILRGQFNPKKVRKTAQIFSPIFWIPKETKGD